jgi:hypothetical protein
MPQASLSLRKKMQSFFGNEIDDWQPLQFLFSHGFTEQAGLISLPVPSYNVSRDEWACIYFLCDEWDYDWERLPWDYER